MFNNNQVLQRRWKVRLKNEVKSNIMIIAVFFHINTSSTLQMQTNLKPCIYMKPPVEDNLNKIKYLDQDSKVKMTQYKHLHDFLVNEIQTEGCLQLVEERLCLSFNEVLLKAPHPKGEVQDIFYRMEFQACGWPHIHALFWIKDAPK